MHYKWLHAYCCLHMSVFAAFAQTLDISAWHNGDLIWDDTFSNGLYEVQWASSLTGSWHTSWQPLTAIAAKGTGTQVRPVPMFYRVVFQPNSDHTGAPRTDMARQQQLPGSSKPNEGVIVGEFTERFANTMTHTNPSTRGYSNIPDTLWDQGPLLRAGSTQGIVITQGVGGKGSGGQTVKATRQFSVSYSAGSPYDFALRLHDEIQNQISALGGRITSAGYAKGDLMYQLSYSYKWVTNIGLIHVLIFDRDSHRMQVSVCCYEHPYVLQSDMDN